MNNGCVGGAKAGWWGRGGRVGRVARGEYWMERMDKRKSERRGVPNIWQPSANLLRNTVPSTWYCLYSMREEGSSIDVLYIAAK